jgi:hypothetical protein
LAFAGLVMTFFFLDFVVDHVLCIWTNANVVHDLLLMFAKPTTSSRHSIKLRFLGIQGGVDDVVAGVKMTPLLEGLVLFSTNVVMRLATVLIFWPHLSVA